MNYKFFIAKRYLTSKKDSKFISFLSYISVIGITLGVAALIIAVSILFGFEKTIKEKVAGLVAHIQITSFNPEGINEYHKAMSDLNDNLKDITGMSPFIQKEAVIRAKGNIEGIIIKGIIPETDLSTAKNRIVKGDFNLQTDDTVFSKIIVGDKLASKINLSVGDKVIVFGIHGLPSPLNTPRIKQFKVSGIYTTGLRDYDDIIVYTDLKTAQRLFEMGSNVTGIEIKIKDIEKAEELVSKIKALLGYPFYPKSLYKLFKGLFSWVELQKAPTPIILALIILVASFNIVGTLLMMVLEKTQSIGILKSRGASRTDIMKIFIYNGMIIGVAGILAGNILGLGLLFVEMNFHLFSLPEFYYLSSVPILIKPELIIFISFLTMFLVFLASLIPAYLASRFDAVKSLRFN